MAFQDTLILVGEIAGAVIGVFTILYWGYRTATVVSKVDAALPTLFEIHAEFSNNGGNSLRDQIDRLNGSVDINTVAIAKLEGVSDVTQAQIAMAAHQLVVDAAVAAAKVLETAAATAAEKVKAT